LGYKWDTTWNGRKLTDECAGRIDERPHERPPTSRTARAAAYGAVPTYASEASWRSNLWNNVGTALRETDAVELENKSRGRWRWVGEE
jgi:hypothetical protein